MKKIALFMLLLVNVAAFAKPRVVFLPDECGDLSKVKFELKTSSTKQPDGKIKDTYTIKIDNKSGVSIKAKFKITPSFNKHASIEKLQQVEVFEKESPEVINNSSKTVGGTAISTTGINNCTIYITVTNPKCSGVKKTLTIANQKFVH